MVSSCTVIFLQHIVVVFGGFFCNGVQKTHFNKKKEICLKTDQHQVGIGAPNDCLFGFFTLVYGVASFS